MEKSILKSAKINENKDFGSIDESNNHLQWLWLFDSLISKLLFSLNLAEINDASLDISKIFESLNKWK